MGLALTFTTLHSIALQQLPERSMSRHANSSLLIQSPPPTNPQTHTTPPPFPPHLQHPPHLHQDPRTPAVTSSRVTMPPPLSTPHNPAKEELRNRLSAALTTCNELAIPSQALLKLKATPLGELRDYRRIEALPLVALPIIDVN